LFKSFLTFLKIKNKDSKIFLLPTPTPIDIVLFSLTTFFFKSKVIYFSRRLIEGKSLDRIILKKLEDLLLNQPNTMLISDSKSILERTKCANKSKKIPIPQRPKMKNVPTEKVDLFEEGSNYCYFALLGSMRPEKGAYEYDDIISSTLENYSNSKVIIHAQAIDMEMKRLLSNLKQRSISNEDIIIIDEFLRTDEYNWLIQNIDVLYIPYDVESYRSGTSGPLAEALNSNKIVISTKITWAVEEFENFENLILIDAFDNDELISALKKIILLRRKYSNMPDNYKLNDFEDAWLQAIETTIRLQ